MHDNGPYRIYPLPVPRYDLGDRPLASPQETTTPGGGNLVLRTELFDTVGDFSTVYGPVGRGLGGAEDHEWVLRAIAAGAVVQYVPEIVQYHFVDPGRLQLGYRRLHVEARVGALHLRQRESALGRLAVDQDHVLERGQLLARAHHLRQELLLGDQHTRPRVGDHVLDLLGGVGVVDRERGRPEHHPREVAHMELGAVGEHQRQSVPASHPQRGEPAGELVHARAQLRPGERHGVALGADRHLVRPFLGGDAERVRDRGRVRRRALAGRQFRDRAIHRRSSSLTCPLSRTSRGAR